MNSNENKYVEKYMRENIIIKNFGCNEKEKDIFAILEPVDLLVKCANSLAPIEDSCTSFNTDFTIKFTDYTKIIVKNRTDKSEFYIHLIAEESSLVKDIIYDSLGGDDFFKYY